MVAVAAVALALALVTVDQADSAPLDISIVVGGNGYGYTGDGGAATSAQLQHPRAVVVDANDNLYLSDANAKVVRRVDAVTGVITTIAGNGTSGYSGDGGQATSAQLTYPQGMAFDSSGNLYIADDGANVIRRVATNGVITTFAGTGNGAHSGDGGQATSADIWGPIDLAFDNSGNLYIAARWNATIRMVNTATGIITSVVGQLGTGGYSGDGGQATSAKIEQPCGIAFDTAGNMFIADSGNDVIRKVATNGVITTFAGTGTGGYSGDGGPAASAQLNNPTRVAFDLAGNLILADTDSDAVREINITTGVIWTIAGTGVAGSAGNGGPAGRAQLDEPYGVAVNSTNDLYIADAGNNAIRLIELGASQGSQVGAIVDPSLTFTVATHVGACNGQTQSAGVSTDGTSVSLGHVAASTQGFGAQDLTVMTNAANGYTVYVRSTAALTGTATAHVIADVSGSNATPGTFPASGNEAFGYTTSDATLGSGTANRFTSGGPFWAALATSNAEVAYSGAAGNFTNCVVYGVGIGAITPADSYSATVTYTAVPGF